MHGTPRLPLRCRCLGSQCLATLGRHWLHRTPGNVNFSWEKRGNVQTLEWKQNIRLDEPKTEKNYSTQHTDAKGQIKRHTWLAETEGRVFKAEHANLQRQPWQCSFPPARHSRLRCTPGWWWWWVTLFPPIPSSPRPPTHGCSSPALAAAVSSMPPKDKDNPAFFRFLRQFQMKSKTLGNR